MELTNDQYEKIQQYLDDNMTPEQEKNFMQVVENNSNLQEAIQFELALRYNLQQKDVEKKQLSSHELQLEEFKDVSHILSLVQKAGKEWQEENKKKLQPVKQSAKIISFPFSFSVAAAACLLMVITVTLRYMSDTGSPQSIISKNNNTDSLENRPDSKTDILVVKPNDSLNNIPSPQTTVDVAGLYKKFYKKDNVPEESETPEALAEVLSDYKNDEYKTFQNLDINDLGVRGGENDVNSEQNVKEIGYYYKGLAFLQSNNIKQASDNLQWVIENAKNKQLIAKAQWYQALCYLQQGNINNAINLLTLVSNEKITRYYKQAVELLQLLDQ